METKQTHTIAEIMDIYKNSPTYLYPSNKWCLEMASKIPCSCYAELISNAEKIKEYSKELSRIQPC